MKITVELGLQLPFLCWHKKCTQTLWISLCNHRAFGNGLKGRGAASRKANVIPLDS